jgi:hypothetical protein
VVYAEAQMGWADQRLAELVADYATVNIETFDANSLARLLAGLASVGWVWVRGSVGVWRVGGLG